MMARPIRILILAVSALVVVAVVAGLLAWWLVDTDRLGEELENRLAEALDMEVEIGEPPGLSLWRGAVVTIADPELRREGQVVARADSLRVRLDVSALLTGELRPTEVHLERAEASIERFGPGEFSIRLPETEGETLDALSLRRVRLDDARLSYLDGVSELEWLFEGCDLDLRNLRHDGGEREEALATLRFEGELECEGLSQDRIELSDMSADLRARDGVVEIEPISATMFDGQWSGKLTADLSDSPPGFAAEGQLSQFDLGSFMAMLEPEPGAAGKLDLDVAFTARGRTWQEIRESSEGSISLSAGELVLEGYDLDDELDGYADTQRFNLVDVGAVFLAGPFGLVASRGYAFTGMLDGSEGSTTIEQMISEWQVENGLARASDVAFRTPENRLALSGALDFNDYRFDDLKVAVVDSDGCSIVEQRISGRFREPEVEQPNFLVTIAGPLLDLLERGVEAITDEDCEAFYSGSISHP
jgi:hypothetical protein